MSHSSYNPVLKNPMMFHQIKTMGYLWGTSRPPGDLVHVVASGAIELSDL